MTNLNVVFSLSYSMNTKTILGISLAAVFAVSMIFAGSFSQADAINTNPKNKKDGGNHSPDFRITGAWDNTDLESTLSMTVQGTAGGTVPDEAGDIYAYVWFFDEHAVAATSHDFDDTDPVVEPFEYHFHDVTLDGAGCVTEITELVNPPFVTLSGDKITIEGIPGLDEAPSAAATAVLNVDLDRPKGAVCIVHVFDIMPIENDD